MSILNFLQLSALCARGRVLPSIMSNRCKVESCGKWVFEGGLCRGHMLAPQAAGPAAAAAAAAASLFPKQPASLPPVLPGVELIGGAKGGSTAPDTLQSIVARMMQHLRECPHSNEHHPSGSPFCVSVGARHDVPPAETNTFIWSNSWSCTCAGALSRFCSLVPIPRALLTCP